jgi:hypothetical protein
MAAISTHPSLRILAFEGIDDDNADEDGIPSNSVKRDRTKAVAEMLLANQQVDWIHFDGHTFDQDLWNRLVVPRLECNSTENGLFHSKKSRYRQPALPSWQEPWLVWRRALRLYGWLCLSLRNN